jgi:glyceraldehyde-3-phosphate dehydrogenase (NADP+)
MVSYPKEIDFSELREGNEYKYFINGAWKKSKSGKTIGIKNPMDDSIVGKVQACTKEEVNEMILTAHKNCSCWADTPLRERAELLNRVADIIDLWADQLGAMLVDEIGKPIKSAISEITRTAEIFRFTAEAGVQIEGNTIVGDAFSGYTRGKVSMTYRVPLGVILCIGPFNYPFNLTGSKIAPALMAGNSIVMKSATEGSITSLIFGKILQLAGLPPGVFNIITGRGSEIGDHLSSHPDINMIAFTGSSSTGRHIAKIAGMKPLLFELGGKDASIILDDADLELTVKSVISGGFSYSGQRCTAVKRVIPMPGIADVLVKRITEEVNKLTVGNPKDNCTIGPLINNKQVLFVQSLIDDALEKGAKLCTGNKTEGNIIWPTVLDNVTQDMEIAWEEPFGPVLPIIRVKSIEEAIEISNKSEYGLQGSVFTNNIDFAFNIAQELDVGTVQINGKSARGPDHFPFMGTKSSGLGTQGIKYSIESMSRLKSIVMNMSEKGKLVKFCKE